MFPDIQSLINLGILISCAGMLAPYTLSTGWLYSFACINGYALLDLFKLQLASIGHVATSST